MLSSNNAYTNLISDLSSACRYSGTHTICIPLMNINFISLLLLLIGYLQVVLHNTKSLDYNKYCWHTWLSRNVIEFLNRQSHTYWVVNLPCLCCSLVIWESNLHLIHSTLCFWVFSWVCVFCIQTITSKKIFDHRSIYFTIQSASIEHATKTIKCKKKTDEIDVETARRDIAHLTFSLNDTIDAVQNNDILIEPLLDKHTPIKERTITVRPNTQRYTKTSKNRSL